MWTARHWMSHCSGTLPAAAGAPEAGDGVIPASYPLQETGSGDYAERTRLNVLDSDATLILNTGELAGGTALTAELASLNDKPCRLVQLDETTDTVDVIGWLREHRIRTLNVSPEPRVGAASTRRRLLCRGFGIGIPSRKYQDGRMALQRPAEHLCSFNTELYSIVFNG